MEEQNVKSKTWKHIALYSVLIIVTLVACSYSIYSFMQQDKKIEELQKEIQSNVSEKSSCFYLRDSLKRENGRLYVYKPLTKAMLQRDEAAKQLKYVIGDVVMLKVDSSKVVISDVIMGGGNFNYYIQYSVLHKNRSIELVSPDLIY